MSDHVKLPGSFVKQRVRFGAGRNQLQVWTRDDIPSVQGDQETVANAPRYADLELHDQLSGFIDVLNHAGEYDEIVLWFGDEPFCVQNRKTVIETLRMHGYRRNILLNIP